MSLPLSEVSVRSHRSQRVAGLLLILAGVQYWIFEAIASTAWKNPAYVYTYNFVSDLGVTEPRTEFEGRVVSSPLHALMNGSFTALGVLVLVSAVLLFRSVKGQRIRYALLGVGATFAIGSWLVAGFPENTVAAAHVVGAFANILGGNVIAILIGSAGAFGVSRRPMRFALVGLGIVGLVATVFLVGVPGFFNGAAERVAAYSYMIAFMVAGIAFITTRRGPDLSDIA